MAERLMEDIYRGTRQSFDQRVSSVVGMFQNIKQGQARKQQMGQQLAQEKDMLEFKSDLQLEQQKELTEYENQLQQQQRQQQQLSESFKDAQETAREMANKTRGKDAMRQYNVDPFDFGVERQERNGEVVGYRPVATMFGQELSYPEFIDEVDTANQFGEFLREWEKKSENGEVARETKAIEQNIGDDQTQEHIYLGQDQKDSLLSQISQDPQVKYKYYEMWKQDRLQLNTTGDSEQESGGGGGGSTPQTNVIPQIGMLQETLKTNEGYRTDKEYGFAENTRDDWGIGPFDQSENPTFSVDFTGSVASVKDQIDQGLKTLLPEGNEVTVKDIPPQVREYIVRGTSIPSSEDNPLPEDVRSAAERLTGYSEQTRNQLNELFSIYNTYDSAFKKWQAEASQSGGESEYFLDIWNMPKDVRAGDAYAKEVFKPIDMIENRKAFLKSARNYRPDVQATQDFAE